jgi:hypothetical protein
VFKQALIEAALNAELAHHLGYVCFGVQNWLWLKVDAGPARITRRQEGEL